MGETVVENSAASSSREVLDRIAAGPLRGQLVAEVARRFGQRSADEVEEAFHEAYSRGLTSCRWRRDREVYGWLRRAMINLLIDRERRERRELVADTSSGAFLDVADAREEPLRVLGQRQEREDVREIHRSVLKQLGDRQRRVILLHAKGTERKEIARRVAVSENAVKKDLKRVFRVARDQVISRSGHGCADGERLVIRYAFGLGGKGIPTQAQLHLASCERCGQFFRELESWREKVAVLLPLPAVEQASPGTLEQTAQKATDLLGQLKQQAVDGGALLKQHAAATYSRAVDPTPLAGVRPGAAAAAIAGCLAIAGGTTYCVEKGVDSIGGLASVMPQPEPRAESNPSESRTPDRPLESNPPESQTPDSPDFGHLDPMVCAAERELAGAGVAEAPAVVVADAGYWHHDQMDAVASRGIQALIPPDAGKRRGARPGWEGGRYAFMRRVLQTDLGKQLHGKRQVTIEPVFANTKFNRRIDRFLRRGRSACRSEWRLITATHNLLKLHRSHNALATA